MIVLKGAGNDFCLGRDLPHPDPAKPPSAIDVRNNDTEPMLRLFAMFERTSVPIVAVVQGKVQGGACAIVGLCDVVIASDDATFVLPEMQRGIPPCLAMSALARRVPRKALTHLVYSCAPIDAQTALAIGIVSRVVPRASLDSGGEGLHRQAHRLPRCRRAHGQGIHALGAGTRRRRQPPTSPATSWRQCSRRGTDCASDKRTGRAGLPN